MHDTTPFHETDKTFPQTKIFVMKKTFTLLVLLVTAFAACRKEPLKPEPVTTDAPLEIALNETYMPAAKIDSALAVWETAGTTQTVALQRSGNKLSTRLSNFKSGNGTLTVQLFTQTTVAGKPLQWEKRFVHTLSSSSPLLLAAPTSFADAAWNPRMISRNDIAGASATVIIGLRPGDAYFELKNVTAALSKRIVLERSFYLNDTANLVAAKTWVGDAADLDAGGNLVDRHHFETLEAQLGAGQWNKYLIKAQFYAQLSPNYIYETEFILDKP